MRRGLHVARLPDKPDIGLPRYRTVILVHGCFWPVMTARCSGCRRRGRNSGQPGARPAQRHVSAGFGLACPDRVGMQSERTRPETAGRSHGSLLGVYQGRWAASGFGRPDSRGHGFDLPATYLHSLPSLSKHFHRCFQSSFLLTPPAQRHGTCRAGMSIHADSHVHQRKHIRQGVEFDLLGHSKPLI
jgi:DNA mismatch endonuclease Vsr